MSQVMKGLVNSWYDLPRRTCYVNHLQGIGLIAYYHWHCIGVRHLGWIQAMAHAQSHHTENLKGKYYNV